MAKTGSFDRNSETYDAWFTQNPEIYQVELKLVKSLLPPPPASGLEVGVGTGRFAAPLGIATGIEPSGPMGALAQKRGINVILGVAEALPFPDQSFDFVLMMTSICFVDSIRQAFREARRVLRPQGALIVGFIDRASELGQLYAHKKTTADSFYHEATFHSASEVLDHLAATGFSHPEIKQALIPQTPASTIRDGHGQGSFVVIKASL